MGARLCRVMLLLNLKAIIEHLLTGERKALNFLQRLSGIATYANRCMKEIEGYDVEILDTRKTLPGYRHLDKYAVRMGGASNHRFGLYDMVMIKDNHIQVAGGIKEAVDAIRKKIPKSIKIEVETSNIEQVQEALDADVDIIMLDNMSSKMMIEAVALINKRAKIEASGNMTIEKNQKSCQNRGQLYFNWCTYPFGKSTRYQPTNYRLIMNLVIDIGNTRTKFSVFNKGEVLITVPVDEFLTERILKFCKTNIPN